MTNPNTYPFARPQLTLSLAKNKIDKFQVDAQRFSNTCKYASFTAPDQDGSIISHRLRVESILPLEFASVFGEVSADLKHALDQSVHAAFEKKHGTISKGVHFPTGIDEDNFKREVKRRCASKNTNVGAGVLAVIEGTRAFKDGNPVLYAMAEFARFKHRNFVGVGVHVRSSIGTRPDGGGGGVIEQIEIFSPRLIADTKGEYEIATEPAGAKNYFGFKYRFFVKITEKSAVTDLDAVVVLRNFWDIANRISADIQAAA